MNSRRHGFLVSAGNSVTIDPSASIEPKVDKLNSLDEGRIPPGPSVLDVGDEVIPKIAISLLNTGATDPTFDALNS